MGDIDKQSTKSDCQDDICRIDKLIENGGYDICNYLFII